MVAVVALASTVLLAATVLLVATADPPVPAAATAQGCATTPTLPCTGPGSDTPSAVEEALLLVLGPPVGATALSGELTTGTADFSVDRAGPQLRWAYRGPAQNLAFLTVRSTTGGFAVFGIAGRDAGTVSLSGLIGGEVAHARFWTTLYSRTAPVVATALHGPGFLGNVRLGRIEDGRVPCLHRETMAVARCAFTSSSGSWLVSTDGTYARTGQAIGLDGTPGGEYAVAARINEDGTVPALAPAGHDTAGTPAGVQLAGACVVEEALASWNAIGQPLVNHATLEVGTISYPHPDGPAPVRRVDGVSYYIGDGAALNDRYGTERDRYGTYLSGAERCHVLWTSGYEQPAAKRPATKPWPAPGTVDTKSSLRWRGVTNLTVAN